MGARAGRETRQDGWTEQAIRYPSDLPAGAAVVVLALGLSASWFLGLAVGGSGRMAPHWFYLPIIFAAARFGPWGAVLTGVCAGILAGPLTPEEVLSNSPQTLANWATRLFFFVVIGLFVGRLIRRLERSLRKEAEVAAREAEIALRQAALIQTVSHEFRTPLTVIVGAAHTLERLDLAPPANQLLASLHRSADRLKSLVDVCLAASGAFAPPARDDRRRVDQRPVDLERAWESAEQMLGGLDAPERVNFRAGPDAGEVVSSPEMIGFVMRAVVENALKFSPKDSAVDVVTKRLDDKVVLSVLDRGGGFDEHFIDEAFAPFVSYDQSTTRSEGGLGLGLFAARQMVEGLGGDIEISNRRGGGSRVTISIPQRREREQMATAVPSLRPATAT